MEQQTIIIQISDKTHSNLHAKNVEHKHSSTAARNIQIEIVMTFDAQNACEIFNLSNTHIFDFSEKVPILNEDGTPIINTGIDPDGHVCRDRCNYDYEIARVEDYVKTFVKNNTTAKMDITEWINNIHSRIEMLPAIKKKVAEAEKIRSMKYTEQEGKNKLRQLHDTQMRETRDEKRRADRDKHEAIESEWIKNHGSDHLKSIYALGYTAKAMVAKEIGEYVLGPDYVLDYNETVEDETINCPSKKALDELIDMKTRTGIEMTVMIVWLPGGLTGDPRDGCETVRVIMNGNHYYKLME